MPRAAVDAALDTFVLVMRERHPGMVTVPLRDVGADGTAPAPGAGHVVRPFAAPENRRPVLDWNAGAIPLHDHRVDRTTEDALAITDR